MRIYDWRKQCPEDVARPFPPIVGRGRGVELTTEAIEEAHRKLRNRPLTREEEPT